jgi:hypothetical protein
VKFRLLQLTLLFAQLEAALRRIEEIAVGMEGAHGAEAAAPKGNKSGVIASLSRLKAGSKKLNSVYPL